MTRHAGRVCQFRHPGTATEYHKDGTLAYARSEYFCTITRFIAKRSSIF
jgi:hypothetical protein